MSDGQIQRQGGGAIEEESGGRRPEAGRVYGSYLTRALLMGGLVLFVLLVWRIGPSSIGSLLWRIGWALPFVFLPYVLVIAFETLGWWFAFPSHRHPIGLYDIMRCTVAAKSVQLVTPSISQAGEFAKLDLLRTIGVNSDVGTASVVVAKTTIIIAELLFIGTGLAISLSYIAVEPSVTVSVLAGVAVMGVAVVGLLFWQRIGMFRSLIWVSRRLRVLTAFVDRHEGFLSSTDSLIKEYMDEKKRFGLSCLAFFLGWAAGVAEVWVLLSVLGLPQGTLSALVIQVWSVIVTRLTTFVPGNLGTQEAGMVAIFSSLGLTPESGMAFAILRRIRQVGWIAVGFGLFAKASRA